MGKEKNKILDWPTEPEYTEKQLKISRRFFRVRHNKILNNIYLYLGTRYPGRIYAAALLHESETGSIRIYNLHRKRRWRKPKVLCEMTLHQIPRIEERLSPRKYQTIVSIYYPVKYRRFIKNLANHISKKRYTMWISLHPASWMK